MHQSQLSWMVEFQARNPLPIGPQMSFRALLTLQVG
jgi:hypothetical protein